jgi:hypothetical protein
MELLICWPIRPIEREGKVVVVVKVIVCSVKDEDHSDTSKRAQDAVQLWLGYKEGSPEK